MRHAGEVVTRSMLLKPRGITNSSREATSSTCICTRLRQKVDQGFSHPLIHTVPGAGYMIRDPDAGARDVATLNVGTFVNPNL